MKEEKNKGDSFVRSCEKKKVIEHEPAQENGKMKIPVRFLAMRANEKKERRRNEEQNCVNRVFVVAEILTSVREMCGNENRGFFFSFQN